MRPRQLAIWTLIALLGAGALVWLAGTLAGWPRTGLVAAFERPAINVRLRAADGVPIAGTYWPGLRREGPAILLLHGINNDRGAFREHARWLHGLGYAVLAIDFRGHGASGPADRTFGWREAEDARAALRYLRRDAPARKVGVVGVSLGGAAALIGPEGPLPADAMVLHAVYPDIRTAILNRLERAGSSVLAAWAEPLLSYQSYPRYGVAPARLSPIDGLRLFRGAVLLIGGTDDRDTRIADSRALFAAARGEKALWLVPGADHVETSVLWTDEYRARVGAFFARHLGAPGPRDTAQR